MMQYKAIQKSSFLKAGEICFHTPDVDLEVTTRGPLHPGQRTSGRVADAVDPKTADPVAWTLVSLFFDLSALSNIEDGRDSPETGKCLGRFYDVDVLVFSRSVPGSVIEADPSARVYLPGINNLKGGFPCGE